MTAVLILSFLLFACYAGLLLIYRRGWRSIPNFEASAVPFSPTVKISVIIPARNEEANIWSCIDSILAQSYPKELYEIIVVDDHSTDDTATIIQGFDDSQIKYLDLSKFIDQPLNSYKKKAIEVGVQHASGELIITTDADCMAGPDWLLTYAAFYQTNNPVFIAAPVSINCSMRFIELFQALDFMTLQGITGASVHRKMHNMCNGANLAYTKKAFETVGGFTGIDNLASGDDMLLMHKIHLAYRGNLMFMKSKAAIVKTAPVKTISEFFNQRIRWASKADKYDDKRIFVVLLLVYLLNLLLLVLPVLAIFFGQSYVVRLYPVTVVISFFELWLLLLISKTLFELYFLMPVAKFFRMRSMLFLFPLMQPLHIIYTVITGFLGKFGSYHWKDRKVK